MNKYNAHRTIVDGVTFASKKEARRYGELRLLQKSGDINQLRCHPSFGIVVGGKHICTVVLDFGYNDRLLGTIYEDVKSSATNTAVSKLKRKLLKAMYDIDVTLVF